MRLEYFKTAPEAIQAMARSSQYLENCSIEAELRYLVELRVSQINGCAYCVDLHSQQIRDTGKITEQQLDCLTVWREVELFDQRQKASLEWAEAVTRIETSRVDDDLYQRVSSNFTDKELVDLTVIVATMNAWNRMAVSFRRGPGHRSS